MSDISSIKVPEVETPYTVKDRGAVHLSGSNVAAADFMLNLQNNAGGAIKWPSGDMTDLKRGWTAADGFTGAGVGADIPSIATMIDAKMGTAAASKERLVTTIPANTYATYRDALVALKPTYDALTDAEKRNAYLLTNNSRIYRNLTLRGFFMAFNTWMADIKVAFYVLYLPNQTAADFYITGTEGLSVTAQTESAQTAKIDLYVGAH